VVLAAADVAVGTLAFVPLALLRIRERPASSRPSRSAGIC
jgi:hypothetical protein